MFLANPKAAAFALQNIPESDFQQTLPFVGVSPIVLRIQAEEKSQNRGNTDPQAANHQSHANLQLFHSEGRAEPGQARDIAGV